MKSFAKQPESDTIAAIMGDPKFRGLASVRDPDVYQDPQPPPPATVLLTARRYLTPVSGGLQSAFRVRLDDRGHVQLSSSLRRALANHEPNTPTPKFYVRMAVVDDGELIIERCKERDQFARLVAVGTNALAGAYDWAELKRLGYKPGWFHAELNERGTEVMIRPSGHLGEFVRARRKGGKAA